MADDIDIDDDGFDGFDDFDAPDFGGEPGGGSTARTPITAAASGFTEGVTDNLLSVNAGQRILREGLPEGYGKSLDLVDEVATEASDLYDKAEKRLEPAIKSTKEATRALLPKAEGILPKGVYEKIAGWAENSDDGRGRIDADEETIASSLGNIFASQMEQQEQNSQESTIQESLKGEVEGQRFEHSTKQLGLIQQAMSRLVGYQDSVTAAYQRKSLDLQFRHYFAARDLLKVQTAGNADVITALNDIKTNTGLPDWVKTENSENLQSMIQERIMGGTADTVSDYMSKFKGNLFKGLKLKVLDTVGEAADGLDAIASGASQMADMSAMVDDGSPSEGAATTGAGFVGDMAGGTLATKFGNFIAEALKKESGADKFIASNLMGAKTFVDGISGTVKEALDGADETEGLAGTILRFVKDAVPAMDSSTTVLNNLAEDATKSVEWDLLSRRTLIDIIPEYLARITQNTEMIATGKPAEKLLYSKTSEAMVTEKVAIAEATDRFVNRDDIKEYRSHSDAMLDKLFGNARISDEARAVMSEQAHTDLSKGWNMDPTRYVETGAFESRFDIDAVAELRDFFKDKFSALDIGVDGEEKWSFNLSKRQRDHVDSLQSSGKRMQDSIPNAQAAINEFAATGDKDLLRSTGWIDNSSGKDTFNQQRMDSLMSGRISLDDLDSEQDAARLRHSRKSTNPTQWRETDEAQNDLRKSLPEVDKGGEGFKVPTFGEVSSPYGNRKHPISGEDEIHSGIDIAGELGSPIRASSNGKITRKEMSDDLGNVVEMEHPDGTTGIYGHLSKFDGIVEEGKEVKQGDIIGYMGDTGSSTGSHLHFEVRKSGDNRASAINPLDLFENGAFNGTPPRVNPVSGEDPGMGGPMDEFDTLKDKGLELSVQQLGILTEIRDLTAARKESTVIGAASEMSTELLSKLNTFIDVSSKSGVIGTVGSGIMNAGKGAAGMLGDYYSGLSKGAGKLLDLGGSAVSKATGFLTEKKEDVDIFISGLKTPAIRGEFIKTGRYIDVLTGKAITGLDDIKGAVKDLKTGNLVITAEDYINGLYGADGGSLLSRMGSGILDAGKGAAGMLGDYYGSLFSAANGAKDWVMGKVSDIDRKMKTVSDVYVKSRMGDGPILLRTKLLRGEYFTKSGDPIYHVTGLDEPVYDDEGNMLITDEDLSAGLVDPEGNKIETSGLLGAGLGIAGMGVKFAADMGAKAFKGLKGYYSGLGEAGTGLMDRLSGLFGDTLSGNVENMSVNATNVYINGVLRDGDNPSESAGTAMPTTSNGVSEARDKVKDSISRAGDKASDITDQVVGKVSTVTDDIVTRVTDFKDSKVVPVVDEVKEKAESTFNDIKGKAGGLKDKVKDKLVGAELGEDSILVGDSNGNVSIKNGDESVPAGDGSAKGYLAALLAYFHSKDNEEENDTDGDGLRDGGWRSKLFGKKSKTSDKDTEEESEGPKKSSKGMLSSIAGMFGMGGGGNNEGGDDGSLMGDVAQDVGTDYLSDKFSGGGDDNSSNSERRDDDSRRRSGRGGRTRRAWDAIKGTASRGKNFARSLGGKGIIGGTMAGLAGIGGLFTSGAGSAGGAMAASSGIKRAALWGLKGALGLVGGVLGSPVLGTALAVAGAAYTAYEAFGFLSDREGAEELEEYRWVQYGLNPDTMAHRSFLRKLEREAIDKVVYKGTDGVENSMQSLGEDVHNDMMNEVGIDPDVPYEEDPVNAQRFADYHTWFKNRFVPVFLLHHGIVKQLDGSVDLLDIDDEIDDGKKGTVAKEAYYPNAGEDASPYFVKASPIEDYFPTIGYSEIDTLRDNLMAEYPKEEEDDGNGLGSMFMAVAKTTALGKVVGMVTSNDNKEGGEKSDSSGFKLTDVGKYGAFGAVGALWGMFSSSDADTEVKVKIATVSGVDGKDIAMIDALRFYQYGVEELTEKASALFFNLERSMLPGISISATEAKFTGNYHDVWMANAERFGYSKNDYDGKEEWRQWFRITFLPAYLTYLVALQKLGIESSGKVTLNKADALTVANALTQDFNPRFTGEWKEGEDADSNEDMVSSLYKSIEAASKVKDVKLDLTSKDTKDSVDKVVKKDTTDKVDTAVKADTESKAKPPVPTIVAVKRKVESNKVTGKDGFILPAVGKVSSPWGDREHPVDGETEFHGGIDIAGPEGTEIFSSSGGTITRREHSRKLGYVIFTDNDDGTQSRYAHMSRFEPSLRRGDRVEQGMRIGYMGSTGNSTGSHLHFEVRKDASDENSTLDPSTLFKGNNATKVKDDIAAVIASKEAIEADRDTEQVSKGNGDSAREQVTRDNTPLVKPELMIPTAEAIGGSSTSYDINDVAVLDEVAPTSRQPMMTSPINPTKQVGVGNAENEVGVLQQRRAQLSQDNANNIREMQLNDIGQVMVEQLNSQHRMEIALSEIAKNTKATATGVMATNNVTKDVPTKAEEAKVIPPPPTNGADMNALFNGKATRKVSYPLSMGRG
jgi:murein DD-endopeptidase MepM/ murein hydrolase activator NlpD